MLKNLIKDLNNEANPTKAKLLAGYFKTGKGEYGEGDVFMGVMVPEQRKIAKKHFTLDLKDIQKLLNSKIHEQRLVALLILIIQYEKGDQNLKEKIAKLYLKNAKAGRINNWDLVDLSAPKILGEYFRNNKKDVLYDLVSSKSLWERRIAILTTFYFIKKDNFTDALKIARKLIFDKEDLIQKAVGWMLREVGKKNLKIEKSFLNKFAKVMPRTTLRYSIERFGRAEQKKYLSIKK